MAQKLACSSHKFDQERSKTKSSSEIQNKKKKEQMLKKKEFSKKVQNPLKSVKSAFNRHEF